MVLMNRVLKQVAIASVAASAVAIGPILSLVASAQTATLNGAGATFPLPLYQRYSAELRKNNINMNYQGVGSGAGIKQVIAGTVHFGGTDAPPSSAERGQVKRGMLTVPTAGGAVSVIYNLPGVSTLRLGRQVVPAIFAGQITRWDDAKIAKDNPGVKLPAQAIKVAVRADSSGTTNIFTSHLAAASPYFQGRIGANKAPKWTITDVLKGKGNPGVGAIVKSTTFSIGYVEDSYATSNKLAAAQVQNKKGVFVDPSVRTADQALDEVKFDSNLIGETEDPADGYPIVGMTYLMLYKQYPDAAQSAAVKKMVEWILTTGQGLNNSLGYTRVPAATAQRALQAVKSEIKP
jgi:phosphate transport system substrate-binding protein